MDLFSKREELIFIIDGCRLVLKNDGQWLSKDKLKEVRSKLGKANYELTELNKDIQRRKEQGKFYF